MKNRTVLFVTKAAMIAAVYVVITIVLAPISFGQVQLRVSEALTIMPVFTAAAIPGVFIGCLIGNILGGAVLPDIIFGSLATLVAAVISYKIRIFCSATNSVYDADSWSRRNSILLYSGCWTWQAYSEE